MLELFESISLDRDAKSPLYVQLYEKLKEMIVDGTFHIGFHMPSVRRLAKLLQVNQVTVVSAYRLLEEDRLVYSKLGSGTYVSCSTPVSGRGCPDKNNNIILDELYHQDDISIIKSGQIAINENTVNFASATPTTDLFPVEDFKAALDEVLERDKGNAFAYQDSQGFYPLREIIYETLKESILIGSPENIQVISGAQQGIDIISKAFLKPGDYVITESPTYTGAVAVFKSRGAEIADIQMGENGPSLNLLEYNLKKYKPKLIYTIPSFQNPTGYSYPNSKRADMLKLAERYNAYIIEDDYVSDLDFEARGFTPIKAMDKYNRVIFIKSFSKIFMPGLRLGFMALPYDIQGKVVEAKHTTDISTSGLLQRAFDLYIRKGYWSRHFKFMHGIYKQRYLLMTESLDKRLPGFVNYTRPGGGLNIWLNFPYGYPVGSLLKTCAANDIVFAPGKIFYSGSMPQKLNSLRLSFAAVYNEQIKPGIEKFCEIACSLERRQESYRNMPVF